MTIIVNEEDILETYSSRQQQLAYEYLKAIEVLRKNKNPNLCKMSKRFNIPYTTLKHWILEDTTPFPIRAIEYLKSRGLLPLVVEPSSNTFITFIRCFAFVFGDGHICQRFESTQLSGNYDDLVKLKHEVETNLKIETGDEIYESSKNSYRFNISNTAFARLLYGAGAPKGDKTIQDLLLPEWLLKSKKCVKREFLSVLFGNELSTPRKQGSYPCTIQASEFAINKNINLKENAIRYLSQIRNVLKKEFNIECGKATKVDDLTLRKDGSRNYKFSFNILGNVLNTLRFYIEFSLSYATQKQRKFDKLIEVIEEHVIKELEKCHLYRKAIYLRNRHNWGSSKIAKHINFPNTTIGCWIYHNSKPKLLDKEKLAKYLLESLNFKK